MGKRHLFLYQQSNQEVHVQCHILCLLFPRSSVFCRCHYKSGVTDTFHISWLAFSDRYICSCFENHHPFSSKFAHKLLENVFVKYSWFALLHCKVLQSTYSVNGSESAAQFEIDLEKQKQKSSTGKVNYLKS